MSENLQVLLKEALINNSYDYDSMHKILKKTWENSYSYLYTLQKSYIEYEELFYYSNNEESRNTKKIGHLYLNKLNYACFDIESDLIHVFSREAYRRSAFYNNEFSIDDMQNNPTIFLKLPIILIDDQVIWDYKMKVSKDTTFIRLPFRRNFVIKDLRDNTPGVLRRGNVYTINRLTGGISAIDQLGNKINLDIHFLPSKIVKLRNVIMHDIASDSTMEANREMIEDVLLDYYEINAINDEYNIITVTATTDDIVYIDHKIQVLLVDNIYYQRFKVNKLSIEYSSDTQSFKIAKSNMNEVIDHTGTMFCSIHFPNNYELGTMMIPMDDVEDYYVAHVTKDIANKLNEVTGIFYISMFFVNELHEHKFYDDTNTITNEDDSKFIVVESKPNKPYEMPIPVENFIVMKNAANTDGYKVEKNTDTLQMYYPNIYQLKNTHEKDSYRVYYFYHQGYDLHYTPMHLFYYEYLKDLFSTAYAKDISYEQIINDCYNGNYNNIDFTDEEKSEFVDTFASILHYQAYDHQYGDTDFIWRYSKLEGNGDKSPTEYKMETTKDWAHNHDPWMLREYVNEQKHRGIVYHLFTNSINLKERLRTDLTVEFNNNTTFDSPRYVFALSNKLVYPLELNCRVFVDGLFVDDLYQERNLFIDYIYIPADLVTNDSYIEIEIFQEYSFSQELEFQDMNDEKSISIIEPDANIAPTISDLVMYKNDGSDERFDQSSFSLTMHYKEGDYDFYEDENPDKRVKFTRLENFTIRPLDKRVLNIPLKLQISKIASGTLLNVSRAGNQYVEINERGFGYNAKYIRIFVNGRILPKNHYRFMTSYKCPRILFYDWLTPGDNVYIDITPYRYTQIHYQENISAENNVIDLKGIINKPFDIRYYDVYLNGRKLSLNNVFSIDPWSITLVNIKSEYNLLIFEKERDWEYFGLDYKSNIYYFSVEDLLSKNFLTDEQKTNIINRIVNEQKDDRLNIHPNTNEEEKQNYDDLSIFVNYVNLYYNYELIPKECMNPDTYQSAAAILKDEYSEIYNAYTVNPAEQATNDYDRARRAEYGNVLCLNPDLMIEGSKDTTERWVYGVGHMTDDIRQDILDKKIEIKTTNPIK